MSHDVTMGFVEGSVFSRWLRSSIHMLHEPDAWTIDKEALDTLRETTSLTKIIIHDQDGPPGRRMYVIDMPDFDRLAKVIDRGQGQQYMVPLRSQERLYWRVV